MTITARTARDKGRTAENQLAAWLQANGFPDAERSAHKLEDRGDIAGVPGTCVQVKAFADPMRGLREAQQGAVVQAQGRRPVAVVRLPRVTDPAEWWAATQVQWSTVTREYDLPINAANVGPRCSFMTLARAIDEHGGALRGREWVDVHGDRVTVEWWVTTVERLFRTLREAT